MLRLCPQRTCFMSMGTVWQSTIRVVILMLRAHMLSMCSFACEQPLLALSLPPFQTSHPGHCPLADAAACMAPDAQTPCAIRRHIKSYAGRLSVLICQARLVVNADVIDGMGLRLTH